MDLTQLRYFLAIARAGSFVRAAEQEGLAQPSLSQQMKKLEADLGVPLFDRLGRSIQLTRYGQALVPEAEAILRQLQRTRQSIAALKNEDSGKLTVGAIPTLLPYAFVEPLAVFQKEHPAAVVEIQEQTTENLLEGLRRGTIDIALLALPIKNPEVICSDLFREPLLAAVPHTHPLANLPKLDVARLASERMLLLREGHCLRNDVLTTCTRARAQFETVFESDHLSSIFAMVAAGLGVSLVPLLAARQVKLEGCRFVPVQPKAFRRVGYAQVSGHAPLPLQKNFIRFLRRWEYPIQELPPEGVS